MKQYREGCPYCTEYTEFDIEDVDEYGKIACGHCGRKILACSACDLHLQECPAGCSSESESHFYNRRWAERQDII